MVAMAEALDPVPARGGFSSKIPDYIFGSYIDEVLMVYRPNALLEKDKRIFYSTNDLYSVYALTDSNGTVVERYVYDPYGKVTVLDGLGTTVRTASLYGNPLTFTGRRLDGETGLMQFRFRYYDTELGRFVSRDPLAFRSEEQIELDFLQNDELPFSWWRDTLMGASCYARLHPERYTDSFGLTEINDPICCTKIQERYEIMGYASIEDCVLGGFLEVEAFLVAEVGASAAAPFIKSLSGFLQAHAPGLLREAKRFHAAKDRLRRDLALDRAKQMRTVGKYGKWGATVTAVVAYAIFQAMLGSCSGKFCTEWVEPLRVIPHWYGDEICCPQGTIPLLYKDWRKDWLGNWKW